MFLIRHLQVLSALLMCFISATVCQSSDNDSNSSSLIPPSMSGEIIENEASPILDNLEDSMVNSILKNVDSKFETLSTRIGNIERFMANHQYNNYQHFRLVNNYMKAMENILNFHFKAANEERTEINKILNGIQTEMNELKTTQTDVTSSLEERISSIGNRMTKEFDDLQHSMEKLSNVSQPDQAAITQSNDRLSSDQVNNITDRLDSLSDKLDLIQRNNLSDQIENIKDLLMEIKQNETEQNLIFKLDRRFEEHKEDIRDTVKNITEVFHHSQRRAHNESIAERQLLFQTISELNDNVLRSTDFYRHTGDLIERIVGATETVSDDQDIIKSDLRAFLEFQSNLTARHFSESTEKDAQITESEVPTQCQISLSEISRVINAMTNNSDVSKELNNLVKIASNSLQASVSHLQTGLESLHAISNDLTDSILNFGLNIPASFSAGTGNTDTDLEFLLNTTKGVFEMVEAVASNTGWIPYIFSRLHNLERQTDNNTKIVLSAVQDTKRSFTISNNSPDVWPLADDLTQGSPSSVRTKTSGVSSHLSIFGNNVDLISNDTAAILRKVNSMYRTSNKIYRLIPALTKLLGEPEPLITLVDGNNENEGRVEIYKQGRWGTMCGVIGHPEASYLCRYLGYLGGVSLGGGYFGPGDGAFWRMNVSCLFTRICDVAIPTTRDNCNHDNDVAILCDHMVRLTDGEEDSNTQRITSGYLEIHHRGRFSPVCALNWSSENSRVVCHQLGYSNGSLEEAPYPGPVYAPHTLFLHNTDCAGDENRLDACPGIEWDSEPCASRVFISCI